MRQRRGAGENNAAAAAYDRRLGRGVVRGEKWRIGQKRDLRGQGSRHRVNGRDFQRGRSVESGQDGGNALGQHRLARTGWTQQREVVPARRAHLGRSPGHRLAEQLGEVRRHRGPLASRLNVTAVRRAAATADAAARAIERAAAWQLLTALQLGRGRAAIAAGYAAKPVRRRRQAGGRDHAHAGDQDGLRRVQFGHHDLAEPGLDRGRHGGKDAADRPQPPVQAEFAEEHHPVHRRPRHLARRGEHPDGDGQVEPAAALGQAGRGEPDRDLPLRPFLAAVDDRGPDPVPRLPQRGVGQADQDHPDQAVRDVRLDLDHVAGHAHQGHRVGAGQRHGYPTPRMCSTVNPPVPSYTRPTTSIRT